MKPGARNNEWKQRDATGGWEGESSLWPLLLEAAESRSLTLSNKLWKAFKGKLQNVFCRQISVFFPLLAHKVPGMSTK